MVRGEDGDAVLVIEMAAFFDRPPAVSAGTTALNDVELAEQFFHARASFTSPGLFGGLRSSRSELADGRQLAAR